EAARTDMVGDHAQRLVVQVAGTGEPGRSGDQVPEQVDLVVAMHALQHRGDALQAHAGVDAGRRQRQQGAVWLAVELHEHQVPDLDVAVAVLVGRARGAAGNVRAMVVENFGTRTAGAGVGHLPEVVAGVGRALVVADADDTVDRYADLVAPD